jgi:ABC-type transport system involved in multi-copper enzyme maturation permease subunit
MSLPRPGLNPVFVREMRSRFRGARAFGALTVFLLIMTIATAIAYYFTHLSYQYGYGWQNESLGQSIFITVVLTEGILLGLTAPALTFGLLSSERDRGTWELLLATPLSRWQIISGKVGAVLAYGLLMIAAVLPMLGITFVLGGVSPWSVLLSQLVILSSAALLAAIGLAASAVMSTTSRAAVTAYVAAAAVIVGPWLLLFLVEIGPIGSGDLVATLMQVSPLMLLIVGAGFSDMFGGGSDSLQWIGQQLLLQGILTGWLFLLAHSRVRRSALGRGGPAVVGLLVFGMIMWLLWRLTVMVEPW